MRPGAVWSIGFTLSYSYPVHQESTEGLRTCIYFSAKSQLSNVATWRDMKGQRRGKLPGTNRESHRAVWRKHPQVQTSCSIGPFSTLAPHQTTQLPQNERILYNSGRNPCMIPFITGQWVSRTSHQGDLKGSGKVQLWREGAALPKSYG